MRALSTRTIKADCAFGTPLHDQAQSCFAGRRRPWRLHLGRSRPVARRRGYRDRRVSGTSAGAINAIVAVEGILEGGNAFAREQLDDFWRGVAEASARVSPFRPLPFARDPRYDLTHSPLYLLGIGMMTGLFALSVQPAQSQSAARLARSLHPIRAGSSARTASSSSSTPPMSRPAPCGFFANMNSTPTSCSPRPLCRKCSRRR